MPNDAEERLVEPPSRTRGKINHGHLEGLPSLRRKRGARRRLQPVPFIIAEHRTIDSRQIGIAARSFCSMNCIFPVR